MTLCSDRILQDVTFDRYRCARLVLDCLCIFEDSSMSRMSVAICSILAAKISTSETTVLGSTPKYMRKLLAMVRAKMETSLVDITLKFTLSALWNLTGRSCYFTFQLIQSCHLNNRNDLRIIRRISRDLLHIFKRRRARSVSASLGNVSW